MKILNNIVLPLNEDIKSICAKKLKVSASEISDITFLRKSIDARKKRKYPF